MADIAGMTKTYLAMLEAGRKSGKGVNSSDVLYRADKKYAFQEAVRQQGDIVAAENEDRKKKKVSTAGKTIQDKAFDSIMANQSTLRKAYSK